MLLISGCSLFEAEKTEKIQIEKPSNSSDSASNGNNNIQININNQPTNGTTTSQNIPSQNPNSQPANQIQTPAANNQAPAQNQPISIQFSAHDFDKEGTGYIPPRLSYGGAWIYTKESHPGDITREFNWDVNDVIHVQLNDEKYRGYTPEPTRIELVGGSLRVTFDMKKYDGYSHYNLLARRYIEIPRGSVPQNTPIYLYSTTGEQLY